MNTTTQLFWPALIFRMVAGVCLGLVYTHYYPIGDTFVYFEDAKVLTGLARWDFSAWLEVLFFNRNVEALPLTLDAPRAFFLTKFTSVVNLLTFDNYWLTGLVFSAISFFSAWGLVTTLVRYFPDAKPAAVVAFLFLPSVVFWTSGLLKESLAMAAVYYLSSMFLKAWFRTRPGWIAYLIAGLCLFVAWNLKYYYLAVFIPVALTSLFYRYVLESRIRRSPLVEVLVWGAVFTVPLVVTTFLHPNINVDRILEVMVENNAAYNAASAPEDIVHFQDLQATPVSLLTHAPWALFSGLFRPFFWEANNFMQLLAGLENTLLFLIFITGALQYRRYRSTQHRLLIVTAMVYVVLLAVFITISAPNFGTLSRYRAGYLPFFVFVMLCHNPVMQYIERSISRLVSH